MPFVKFLRGDSSTSIECGDGRSVLDDALSRGLAVDHSCKRGDCGQCAAKLIEGALRPLSRTRTFESGGDIYICNAIAETDAVVRLPFAPEAEGLRAVHSPAKIHSLTRLSDDVFELVLRLPHASAFRFLPGQYIRLSSPERVTRTYSLAAPAAEHNLLCLHVRRVPDGRFSDYLAWRARPGDLLRLEGPYGRMFLRNRAVSKSIFLATGTGIAPILAMIRSLSAESRAACGEVHLYWGNRGRRDAYCEGVLAELAQRRSLKHLLVFSGGSGRFRHVQDAMCNEHGDLGFCRVYAAGNPAMVEGARKVCIAAGLPVDEFHSDPFTAT